jgi:uncharacterized membrane protein YdbT with pleckstrin-like domain
LEEMEANWEAMTDSVEGTTGTSAETSAGTSAETTAGTGVLDSLGALGAFTTLTAAAAAGAGAAAAGAAAAVVVVVVAEAVVVFVLAMVFVYTLYRDVFLSFFTNNVFIRAFQCAKNALKCAKCLNVCQCLPTLCFF